MHTQAIGYKCKITNDSSHLNVFLEWIALSCLLTLVNLLFLGWLTLSSLLTVVNLMLCFRIGDIKSATVSSQLTKNENCQNEENARSQLTLFALQLYIYIYIYIY